MIINYENDPGHHLYLELIESLDDDKSMTVKSFRVLERLYFVLFGVNWMSALLGKNYNSIINYFEYSDAMLTNEINEWCDNNEQGGAACICGLCRHCGTKCLGWAGSSGNRVVDVHDACWCYLKNYEFTENNKLKHVVGENHKQFQMF